MMESDLSILTRDWALRWIGGTVDSYRVSLRDIEAVVSSLLAGPLVNVPRELREERTRPLLGYVERLEGGGSG